MAPPRAICKRWLSLLASFDFEVVHKKNKHLVHADYLSRDGTKGIKDNDEEEKSSDEEDVRINAIISYGTIEDIDWKIKQEQDETLKEVRKWIADGQAPELEIL